MYKIENKWFYPYAKWEKIHSLRPSSYIRKGTLQVFHKIRKNFPNDHILCIGYNRGDTQFAITETFKTYETSIEQVLDRCLLEECSMERVRDTQMECLSFVYTERFATIYCVPLRITHDNIQARQDTHQYASPDELEKDDDKTRKLVLLLHGPPDIIRSVFQHFSSSENDISHIVSVPVQSIQFVFPKFFPSIIYPMKPIITRLPPLHHHNHCVLKG